MNAGDVMAKTYQAINELFNEYIHDIIHHDINPLWGVPQTNTKYYKKEPINDFIDLTPEQEKRVRALYTGTYTPKVRIGNKIYSIVESD